MIVVARDTEGLRLVLAEIFERDHDLFRLSPELEGKSAEHTARLFARMARVTLSPGYERWARHLIYLEGLHELRIPLGELLAVEVAGLQVVAEARLRHRQKHPQCHACGLPQDNRFQTSCLDCGVKYAKKKAR